jgi:ribosomal protein S18 acetylase RimI-like enzyme
MKLVVRLAAPSEAALVHAIMLAAYAEYRGALPVDSSAHAETVDDVMDGMRKGGAILAFEGSQAIGSARFEPEAQSLYVRRVSVLSSHRRRGVASAIMRSMEAIAVESGRRAIRLEVRDSLPTNVSLYRSLGYEVASTKPHPRGADQIHTMIKHLTAHASRVDGGAV